MIQFLTFSETTIQSPTYTQYMVPHILISVTNPGVNIELPNTHHCKQILRLQFVDKEDYSTDEICFDKDMAKQILDFVNNYSNIITSIVVHCSDGTSRSVAIAAALSKIINHRDDGVYSLGVPNMLVYLTILEKYFTTPSYNKAWPKLHYLREEGLKECLTPQLRKIAEHKLNKRFENV